MGRRTTGCIYKRKGAKGYTLEYCLNGITRRVTLRNDDGRPITRRDEARAKADFLLLPLRARNEADRLRAMLAALESAEQAAARAEAAIEQAQANEARRQAQAKTDISRCWKVYGKAQREARRTTEGDVPKYGTNRYNYLRYFRRFCEWWKARRGADALQLADLTADEAREFFDGLAKSKATGTYNKYLHFLKGFAETVFNACGLDGLENPFADVPTISHARPRRRRVLTMEQVKAIFANADGEMLLLCKLGFYTGLRLGDCCTLLWREVDMERRVIRRTPRKTAASSGASVKVGIPAALIDELERTPSERRTGYVLPDCARRYNLNRNNLARPIRDIFERAGLRNDKGYTEYGFHCFRHTFVTMQAEAGTPLAILQGIVGHSNPVMTEHYIGAISDDAAVKYADKVYGGTPTPDGCGQNNKTEGGE